MSTVFDKIVSHEIPAYIIAEDENCMAFLDIFPTVKAQCVVIPKSPTTARFSEADTDLVLKTTRFAQKVAKLIEDKLEEVQRVQVVIEGFEVNYFHIKLFPAINLPKDQVQQGTDVQAADSELKELHKTLTE